MRRSSGILMHISSLPSPYGIGSMGREAYRFAEQLQRAGQSYWQVLPMGPTSYGDSPYQSFSTFAGNPYFIDLDLLGEDGLLTDQERKAARWTGDPRYVDYGAIYETRFPVLRKAFERGYPRDEKAVEQFTGENRWVHNYALFMALKKHFGMKSWLQWEDRDACMRRPHAMAKYEALLAEDIRFYTYLQYLFFRQWTKLKAYINSLGIQVIGDLPIYVAMDSADVWAEPEFFQLDRENMPVEVSGVPPDYFCEDGQLWGNPLYDYDAMRADGFGWWIRRVEGAARLFDVIRIDHFRGLESFWAVPYGDKTARNGRWRKGPGMDLVGVLTSWFNGLSFIAEDLGFLTPEVHKLLKDSGLPGMKVLEFAFDPREPSNYLPHTYDRRCICYVGTHDNETLDQWLKGADEETLAYAREYLGVAEDGELHWAIIRAGMRSVADVFVTQMQDYLQLGAEGRMNEPGTAAGNWRWRLLPGEFTEDLVEKIARCTELYGRSNPCRPAAEEEEE